MVQFSASPFVIPSVPASVRVRLCVSMTDPDWKERIKAAAEGRGPSVVRPHLDPYQIRVHPAPGGGEGRVIEVRPRAGHWLGVGVLSIALVRTIVDYVRSWRFYYPTP